MGETENKNTAVKESWFKPVLRLNSKIIWPTKESLARQTTAVVIVSVVLGLIITLLDTIIQYGVNFLVNL